VIGTAKGKGETGVQHAQSCSLPPLHGLQLSAAAPHDHNRHKLKHRKFCLNVRKNFFPLRVMEHWNRLPREVVDSPSPEILKTFLDKVLCSLL